MSAKLWSVATVNAFSTTLSGAVALSDATINLTSITGLQAPGVVVIDRVDANNAATPTIREYVSYTGISGNSLTGCTRGLGGSAAQAHNSGAKVEECFSITHWNDLISFLNTSHDSSGHILVTSTATIANLTVTTSINASGATGSLNNMTLDTPTIRNYPDWQDANETWTYSSNDSTNNLGVFNVGADVTSKYSEGMKTKYTQSQSLTAYWSMDSGSTDAINSLNGTDTSMTYTSGKFSNAATFNGTTSKIAIADNSLLKPTGDFTLGLWFKTSVTGGTQFLFQSYSQNTNVSGIYLFVDSNNKLEFLTGKNTGATLDTDFSNLTGTTNIADGNWHYVVCTVGNNYGQMYLDGELEASGFMLTPAYAATNYIRIGCQNVSGTDIHFLSGSIDDVFFINGYSLSEKHIRNQYNASVAQGSGSITVTKYGIIAKVGVYSGGNTPLSIYGGTDSFLTNATISTPYYSAAKAPQGFPENPAKWMGNNSQMGSRLVSSTKQYLTFIPRNNYVSGTDITVTGASTWTAKSLQSIVGKKAVRARLYVTCSNTTANTFVLFAKNSTFTNGSTTLLSSPGGTNDLRVKGLMSLAVSVGDFEHANTVEFDVDLDSSQSIQVIESGGSWQTLGVLVTGWYEPLPVV